jgi:septin family protein
MKDDISDLKLITSVIESVNLIQIAGNIDLYTTPELKDVFDALNKLLTKKKSCSKIHQRKLYHQSCFFLGRIYSLL